jgi:hypothetical protein
MSVFPSFPRRPLRKSFKIKGQRAIQASDAEKSITGKPSSSDVQILWKKKITGHLFNQTVHKALDPRYGPVGKPKRFNELDN